MQPLTCHRMREAEHTRMQGLAPERRADALERGIARRRAVECVCDERGSSPLRKVDADLMRATGFEPALHPCRAPSVIAGQHAHVSYRSFPLLQARRKT